MSVRRQNNVGGDFPNLRYPPAANPFNPTSLITGKGGFWRADMGVTQSGGNVSAWADQSSFATNLTNQTNKPTWSSTGFNTSFPGVTLADNTTSGGMQSASISCASSTFSFFMLFNPNNSTTSIRWSSILTATGGNDFTNPSAATIVSNSTSDTWGMYSSGQQGDGGSLITLTNGTIVLLGWVADGTHANLWQNGSVVGSATNFSSTIGDANTTLYWGASAAATPGAGQTCAFFGYTQKAMNSTDWTNLKNWSNSNWGTSF